MDVITTHVAQDTLEMEHHAPVDYQGSGASRPSDRGEGAGGGGAEGDNIFKSTYQNVAKFGKNPIHITLKLMKASKYLLNKGVLWLIKISMKAIFLKK